MIAFLIAALSSMVTPVVLSEFVYESAPFPSCHASTIVEVSHGKLIAAWFGGTAESNPDVCIYLSSKEPGKPWGSPIAVADGLTPERRYACYNPVLFKPRKGPLLLFYKVGAGPSTWWGMLTTSKDEGRTWTKPQRLPDGILGPIKNKPIQVGDSLLCPSSSEDRGWQVHFEITRDFGKTWIKVGPVNDGQAIGAIQPSLLVLGRHHLRAIGRTRQERIFAIDSNDDGLTWGPMRLISLPNPNSGTDAVTMRDGRHLLVYNDTTRARTPLNVAVSKDGEHWTNVATLESGPGEYSYPAVIQAHDGLIHITYTWQRTRIRHVVLDPSRIP